MPKKPTKRSATEKDDLEERMARVMLAMEQFSDSLSVAQSETSPEPQHVRIALWDPERLHLNDEQKPIIKEYRDRKNALLGPDLDENKVKLALADAEKQARERAISAPKWDRMEVTSY